MKFQDKFYDIIDYNKCPSSEKSAEKCILRKSYFHHSEPRYNQMVCRCHLGVGGPLAAGQVDHVQPPRPDLPAGGVLAAPRGLRLRHVNLQPRKYLYRSRIIFAALAMSRAWERELVRLAAVGSCVLSLLPRVSSLITSSALPVATSDRPATWGQWSHQHG